MPNVLLRLLAAIVCSAFGSAVFAEDLVKPERVDAALAQMVDAGQLVGVSGLVYEKGQEVYFGAHGYADREAKRPMRRDTLAYIYSMTKPITAVCLMQLHEQGKFRLDDPLAKHAPEFADPKVYAGEDASGDPIYEAPNRPPTIRDVCRNTAGFTRGEFSRHVGEVYRAENPGDFNNPLTTFAQKLGRVPLGYQPGARWVYGDSVDVQAFLVERLSGQPFAEYRREHVLDPLGMDETRTYHGPEQDERRTKIYEYDRERGFSPEDERYVEYNKAVRPLTKGGSGLVSTLDDYMRFARMLLGGGKGAGGELNGVRILQPETIELMATNALPSTLTDSMWLPTKGQMGFGIVFATRIASPATRQEHSGEVGEFFWDGRASTLFWVDPENEIAAVLFTQMVPFNATGAHKQFRDAIYWDDETAAAPRG